MWSGSVNRHDARSIGDAVVVGTVVHGQHRVGVVEVGGRVRQGRRQVRVEGETGEAQRLASRPAAGPARGPDPAIGAPSSPSASGAASPTMPGRRTTSHCQPDHATRVPARGAGSRRRVRCDRRARASRTRRRSTAGSSPIRGSRRCRATRDFPALGSTGRSTTRSDSKVTNPFASRAARSRSTIRRLAAVVGSTAYRSTARTTSYGPVSPNGTRRLHRARRTTDSIPRTAMRRSLRGRAVPLVRRWRGRDRGGPGTPRTPSRRASTRRGSCRDGSGRRARSRSGTSRRGRWRSATCTT